MQATKIYSFSVGANQAQNFPVGGGYVKILSCTGPLLINGDSFGDLGPINVGQGLERTPFTRLTIQDLSGANNSGTFIVAPDNFVDTNVYGTVSTIDVDVMKSKNSLAFSALVSIFLSGGTSLPYAQLFNPAASSKRLIVNELSYASDLAVGFSIALNQLDFGCANVSTPVNNSNVSSVARAGGFTISVTTVPPPARKEFEFQFVQANSSLQRKFKNPIILNPGNGLLVIAGSLTNKGYTTFNYTEEPL